MSRYIISPLARADIFEIWERIAGDSIDNADKVRDDLFDAFRRLAKMPEMGHERKDVTELPVRFWSVFNYLVVYRVVDKQIEIVTVVHGARELKTFFAKLGDA